MKNKITTADRAEKLASYTEYTSIKKRFRRTYNTSSEYNTPKYEYGGISKGILDCLNKYGNTIISIVPYFEQLDKIWCGHYGHDDAMFPKHITDKEIVARITKCENHMIKQLIKNIGKPVTLRYVKPVKVENVLEGTNPEYNRLFDRDYGFFVIQS